MKRFISIFLAVAVIFSAIFCVSASASRSTDFLEKFERDLTVTYSLDNSSIKPKFLGFSLLKASIKYTKKDDGKYSFKSVSRAKFGLAELKVIGDSDKAEANLYFLMFKINLKKIADNFNVSLFDDFSVEDEPLLSLIDSGATKYLKFINNTEEEIENFGKVTVENLGPNYAEIVKDLPAETQEELEGKTDEEIAEALAEFAESDDPELRFFAGLTNAYAKFYYMGDDLVRYIFEFPDKKTGSMLFARDWPSDPVIISADIDDDAFDEPKFSIDITNSAKVSAVIVKSILDTARFFKSIFNIPGKFLG